MEKLKTTAAKSTLQMKTTMILSFTKMRIIEMLK